MSVSETLDLAVHVPADEWAYCQRRLAYLETLLLRLVRDRRNIQEWYDAGELAALRLPGLPATAQAIARRATTGRWQRRRAGKGRGSVYHVASLPSRAFDALIARILDLPEPETEIGAVPDLPPAPAGDISAPAADVAPPWVLPLVRLMKGEAQGSLGRAWHALPSHLPRGTALPTVKEAAQVLVNLGLA